MKRKLSILAAVAAILLPIAARAQSGIAVQQSETSVKVLFLVISSTDHITGLTGATPTVTLSKNGGSFASPAGTVAEVANGWYALTPTSADTGTLGVLILHATASGGDPCDVVEDVVAYNPGSATNLGLSALPTASPAASGGLPTVGTSTGQVNPTTGTFTGVTLATGQNVATVGGLSPPTNWASANIDSSGRVLLQPSEPSVTIPTVTTVGSVAGAVGSVTGNVGGNVVGSTGSVTGAVGSVTGAVGSVVASVTVGAYASNEDPATLVLGALLSTWDTSGTIGYGINNASSAGNPWSSSINTGYSGNQAGAILYAIRSGQAVTLPSSPPSGYGGSGGTVTHIP